MTNDQRSKLDACNRVTAFNAKYAADLATISEYATEQTAFADAMQVINQAAQVQSGTVGTATDAVQAAKENMATITIKYALRGLVKAKQIGDSILVKHLDHGITYIIKATKTLAVQRAKDINQHLNDNLTTLTNLTPINITEITDAISTYDNLKDKPIINIHERVSKGTNPLPAAFEIAFKSIDNMYDLAFSYFAESNKEMVDELALTKKIIMTGVRHNGIAGKVTKNGQTMANANVRIIGSKKFMKTNAEGYYSFPKVKSGNHIIEVNLEGILQSKETHHWKGNSESVDFEFE